MRRSSNQTLAISSIVALSMAIASCGESRVSQCQRLIAVASNAVTQVEAVIGDGQLTSTGPALTEQATAKLTSVAEAQEQALSEMQALELPDQQLQGFQQRFVSLYSDVSRASRDLVAAAQERDPQAVEQANNAFQAAIAQETPLVNEVNTYCVGDSL
mgnify:CR=1 FL=1